MFGGGVDGGREHEWCVGLRNEFPVGAGACDGTRDRKGPESGLRIIDCFSSLTDRNFIFKWKFRGSQNIQLNRFSILWGI